MKPFSHILPFFLVVCSSSLQATSVSLIIPCHYKHAPYLFSLLKEYEKQTIVPDEVVIAISEYNKIDSAIICSLSEEPWRFNTRMILTEEPRTAGENRNAACESATGNIFILQDADDFPHPQRVEIVLHFFNEYKIDYIIHQFIHAPTEQRRYPITPYNIPDIPYTRSTSFTDINMGFFPLGTGAVGGYTHGHVAITKQLFYAMKWDNKKQGQDLRFTEMAYKLHASILLVKVPLIIYRHYLSSHRQS